jgi:glucosamine--fructose-6-phosphate aminotransferase (isomerizing)
VIGVSFEENSAFATFLPVEKNGIYTPISSIVYSQLLAYYIALEKNLDPDKPRNLAKSVTVK